MRKLLLSLGICSLLSIYSTIEAQVQSDSLDLQTDFTRQHHKIVQTTSLTAKNFNQGVISSNEQLFQGKIAGLTTTPNTGSFGSSFQTLIRGYENPLYVIDDLPLGYNPFTSAYVNGIYNSPDKSLLSFLNPNDIQSVEVLKDAVSNLYDLFGNRSVIRLKTKYAQGLQFTSNTSISTAAQKYDLLSKEDFLAASQRLGITSSNFNGTTNWQDLLLQTGVSHEYHIQWGNQWKQTQYQLGGGYTQQKGIYAENQQTRWNFRLGLQQSLLDNRVILEGSFYRTVVEGQKLPLSPLQIITTLMQNPTISLFDANHNYTQQSSRNFFNTAEYLALATHTNRLSTWWAKGKGTWHITPKLHYQLLYNQIKNNYLINNSTMPSSQGDSPFYQYTKDDLVNRTTHLRSWQQTLTYQSADFQALVGYFIHHSSIDEQQNSLLKYNTGYSISQFTFAGNRTIKTWLAHVNYTLANKYALALTLRKPDDELYGSATKALISYYALAGKWSIGKERFMPKSLQRLALRGTWVDGYDFETQMGITSLLPKNKRASVGIDWQHPTGKMQINVDYFTQNQHNIPLRVTRFVPPGIILTGVQTTEAQYVTNGIDLSLEAHILQQPTLNWVVSGNVQYLNEKYLQIPDANNYYTGRLSDGLAVIAYRNENAGRFYVNNYTGLDNNGIPQYEATSTLGANFRPRWSFNLHNQVAWHQWQLAVLLQGMTDYSVYNYTADFLGINTPLYNGNNAMSQVKYSNERSFNGVRPSNRFISSGNFLRVQQLTLGYTFKLPNIQSLTVALTGQNLWLFSAYQGLDPEPVFSSGIDYATLPMPRSFSLKIQVKL